jgi:PIN domain nuclease of toxin-antitoxin system
LGKLNADPAEVLAAVEPAGFNHMPVLGAHAAKVVTLPPIHRDPFDRILVAQARTEPMILLTNDELLRGYGDIVEIV